MNCETFRHLLIESLYEEIDPDGRRRLEDHLGACEACRREQAELRGTSRAIRDHEPESPSAPRVVVLAAPRRRFRSVPAFVAGFASAAAVLLVGLFVGSLWLPWSGARSSAAQATVSEATTAGLTREDLDSALAGLEDRVLRRVDQDRASWRDDLLADVRDEMPSRADVDQRFARYDAEVNERRRRDLKYMMNEILASQMRSDAAFDETQQALRYVAMKDRPGVSEW